MLIKLIKEKKDGKNFSVIVVSEGAREKDGVLSIKRTLDDGKGLDNVRLGGSGEKLAGHLEELTGIASRATVLGYVQRGGTPTAYDRVLSTKYGVKAVELAMEGIFNVLVSYKNGEMTYVPLDDVVGKDTVIGAASSKNRTIEMNDPLIHVARKIGICLGD